ncbi:uncharacterized protein DMENIID0001_012780 [Sergentomyia squamirostris]
MQHMESVPKDELNKPNKEMYLLPHHAVLRPGSETTKLRVVFDASAPTQPNNASLNDILAVGPTIQDDIFTHLIRFRTYVIAFVADIEKMYRQILIDSQDRDFQRIFWRKTVNEVIGSYRLRTVTYGTACAPYLAMRVLQQIAIDYKDEYPNASDAIMHCFYMDDLLCGADSLEEAKKLRKEIEEVLNKGKLPLRKFRVIYTETTIDYIIVKPFQWSKRCPTLRAKSKT